MGGQHTLGVGETDCQGNRLRLTLANVSGGIPDPASVAANVGRQLHVRDD